MLPQSVRMRVGPCPRWSSSFSLPLLVPPERGTSRAAAAPNSTRKPTHRVSLEFKLQLAPILTFGPRVCDPQHPRSISKDRLGRNSFQTRDIGVDCGLKLMNFVQRTFCQ